MNLLHFVYAKVWGGGEQYVYSLCKEEVKRGHQNFIIIDPKQKQMIEKFTQVATVLPVSLQKLYKFISIKKILGIIDKYNIDILNCHSGTMAPISATVKMLRPSIKLVIYKHNASKNHRDLYHRWIQKKADAFVCVSKLVQQLQTQTACPKYANKFHLIYNGIDTQRFIQRARVLPTGTLKIGYAGRIVENKGLLVLLEAVKILREKYQLPCSLSIAASSQSDFKEKCQEFVNQNKLNDVYHFLPNVKDMGQFYDNIDVFVLPSLIPEAFGLVLCEAMYSALPVVSSNNGAQREIIENGVNGILLPPNDAVAIAKSIKELSRDAEKYQQISLAACKRVEEKFTLKVMVNQLNQLFSSL
ncbi:MAG: glycosyltransferase family 4 protein [Elusimicrobiaceae bacterium]|nr:glycosyltransferase family 4 protein [Elusimicrobiaceae bacterium]